MHVLIITGGELKIDFAKSYCKTLSFDRVFAVDRGLEYVRALSLEPDYIVGDFDTVSKEILWTYEKRMKEGSLNAIMKRHPARKDATDTELALEQAFLAGAKKITILGGIGTRMDHTLANLYLLKQAETAGVFCQIVDACNRIQMLSPGVTYTIRKKEQYGRYVSLIPVSEEVMGLTITGMRYPLTDVTVQQGSSLTVSNEIEEEEAAITFAKGCVLLVESRDA